MLALSPLEDLGDLHYSRQPMFLRHEREPAAEWSDNLVGFNDPGQLNNVAEAFPLTPSTSNNTQPVEQMSPASLSVPQRKRTKSERLRRKEKLNRPLPPIPIDQLEQYLADNLTDPNLTTPSMSSTLDPQSATSHSPPSQSSHPSNLSSPDQVYSSLKEYVTAQASKSESPDVLQDVQSISSSGTSSPVSTIIGSCRYRVRLEQALSHMDEISHNVPSDALKLNEAITKDEANLVVVFEDLLALETHRSAVLLLDGDDAEVFMDAIQQISHKLESGKSNQLNKLLIELSKRSTALPDTLFITGVAIVQGHNSFGGTFGDIYRSTYKGRAVALKRLRIFQNSDRGKVYKKFCAEARVWHRLKHRFVLPFLGVDAENFPRQPCMVSPWMNNGTVTHFLKKNPRANVDKLLYEVAQGVSYLHSQGVVHGDLKGVNILIDDAYHAQLADFGLTVLAEATQHNTTDQGGTVRYMAPELLNPTQFGLHYQRTFETDMYAYACLCIELYTRQIPFAHLPTEVLVMDRVIRGERPSRPSSMTNDELWSLVTTCWSERRSHRLAADAIVIRLKDILRSSATSSTCGAATPRLSPTRMTSGMTLATMTEQATDDDASTVHPENGTERQSQRYALRTARTTRRAREDGEDDRAYSLQPIRTHADPSRVYHNLREESCSASVTINVAQLKGTKSVAVIKKIKVAHQSPRALSHLADEFLGMRYLHHANLVNYIDVFKYREDVWVLMERLTNTISLRRIIDRNSREPLQMKETFARTVLRSLLQAVDYLHRHGVSHGYINAENVVLVDKSRNIRLQLCAMISEDDQSAKGSKRPAPEVVAEADPTPYSDVWDVGILTLDILGGDYALDWTVTNPLEMLARSRLHATSESLRSLLQKVLVLVPDKRPSPSDLLRHPFLVRRKSTSDP